MWLAVHVSLYPLLALHFLRLEWTQQLSGAAVEKLEILLAEGLVLRQCPPRYQHRPERQYRTAAINYRQFMFQVLLTRQNRTFPTCAMSSAP